MFGIFLPAAGKFAGWESSDWAVGSTAAGWKCGFGCICVYIVYALFEYKKWIFSVYIVYAFFLLSARWFACWGLRVAKNVRI